MEGQTRRLTAVGFIGAVAAVVLVVAAESQWNTGLGGGPAGELGRLAGAWRTRPLVAHVSAVIVAVTQPRHRRTAPVCTGELVTGARVIHCISTSHHYHHHNHHHDFFKVTRKARNPLKWIPMKQQNE